MIYLLDGYNILFKLAHAMGNNIASQQVMLEMRERFVGAISGYFSRVGIQATCFFDGRGEPWLLDNRRRMGDKLKVIYTGEETADAAIIRRVEQSENPHKVIVVTEDREIVTTARNNRARVMTSTGFIDEVAELRRMTGASGRHEPRGGTPKATGAKGRTIGPRPASKTKASGQAGEPSDVEFDDIERAFRNIDMDDILRELEEEDGFSYS